MAQVARARRTPRPSSLTSEDPAFSEPGSLSTLGPSPSERFGAILAAEDAARREGTAAPLQEIMLSPSHAANTQSYAGGDDDDESVVTVTRTVTRVEDLPADKSSAIGTVLEERLPRRVPLLTEFLTGGPDTSAATRVLVNELYDADLELALECQYLPKVDVFTNSDPYVEVRVRDGPRGQWRLVGRTEAIANAHFPRFVRKFALDARPDENMEREVKLTVLALPAGPMMRPPRLGEATCTLWDVVCAPGHCKVMRLRGSPDPRKDSWVVLNADASRDRMHRLAPRDFVVFVRFDATAKPRSKTHFVVCRAQKKGRWTPVYRSEGHANPDRTFKAARMTCADVFAGRENAPCRVEFFQRRVGIDAKLGGFVQFSIRDVLRIPEGRRLQWWTGKDATPPGHVVLEKKDVLEDCVSVWLTVSNKEVGSQ